MPQSLFGRNVLLLVGCIVLGQFTAWLAFFLLVQKPRITEAAQMMAASLVAVRDGLAALPPPARGAFVSRFNAAAGPVLEASDPPGKPLMAERLLVRAISHELATHGIEALWRRETGGRLLLRLDLDDSRYWLATPGPAMTAPARLSVLVSWGVGLLLALIGALLIQRRVDRPLVQLAGAARAIGKGMPTSPLIEEGPREIVAVAHAFNRMQADLAARERERVVMLAGISHDLRTPLTKLRLAIELLEEENGQAVDPQLLESMRGSSARIEAIIEQFIEFARPGTDEPVQRSDLDALLDQALAACTDGTRFARHGRARASRPLRPQAMLRLLGNLLDNALKYGRPPFALRVEQTATTLRIAVTDGGDGIPATALEQLRRPFARGAAARGGPSGAGLGLAIVDRLARENDIQVTFLCPPSGGFEVWLTLPPSRQAAED